MRPPVPVAGGRLRWCLRLRDLDLTKIESRPFRGRRWEYLFYLDFLGHVDDQAVRNALRHLDELSEFVRVLGCYPRSD
ncbi:MAG: prephenate dehydratase [Acidobacteria bacterium]|nr:prephenate dehydratase [Acidobacteriota bacterium]